MRAIALFFTFIMTINVTSSMVIGITYTPNVEMCAEKIETNLKTSDQRTIECCSKDKKEKKNCCDDECDCSCCHHVKVASSQIYNSIVVLEENIAVHYEQTKSFTYKSPYDFEVNNQLLHPPQIS